MEKRKIREQKRAERAAKKRRDKKNKSAAGEHLFSKITF
jgi:hypothetical protein